MKPLRLAIIAVALGSSLFMTGCDIESCDAGQHSESNYEYHYGYNPLTGKYEYHYGTVTRCVND